MRRLIIAVLMLTVILVKGQSDLSPGFKAGAPSEMEQLQFLRGTWNIALKWTDDLSIPRENWQSAGISQSTITPKYNGGFLHEDSKGFPLSQDGHEGFSHWAYNSVFSYDRFNKVFRYIAFDNILGLADIYEGGFKGEQLILTNAKTNTYNNHGTNGSNQKNRLTVTQINDNRFEIIWENIDEDKLNVSDVHDSDWNFVILMVYERTTN